MFSFYMYYVSGVYVFVMTIPLVPWLQVCLLVISQGYLGVALKISATMMKRGHLKETAKISRYLIAAGHNDFKQCLQGGPRTKTLKPCLCKATNDVHNVQAL